MGLKTGVRAFHCDEVRKNGVLHRNLLQGSMQRLFVKQHRSDLFACLRQLSGTQWTFIDGSIIKAHQHSTGANSKELQAIGKSVAGNTSKIHIAVDSGGLPIHFDITGGEVHDSKLAPELIDALPDADYFIADKGYDSEPLREQIRKRGALLVIHRKHNSQVGNADIDWCLYRYRHLVENIFARLKHYRAIATLYDKLQRNYASTLALTCSIIWLPMWSD